MVDLADLRLENEKLKQTVSKLSEVAQRITSSLDLSTVLQEVVDAACELAGARYGALGVLNSSGRLEQFITHGVAQEERERISRLPVGLGMTGSLLNLKESMRLDDVSKHPAFAGFPPGHPHVRSLLGMPIKYGDEVLGNLYLAEREEGVVFSQEVQEILELFVSQAAIAIHNAQAHQKLLWHIQEVDRFEKQFRDVLDNTGAVVYIKDLDGKYLFVNRQHEKLFGTSREGIRGKTDYDILPKDTADKVRANDRDVLEKGDIIQFEEVVPVGGIPRTYISVKCVLKDGSGKPYAVYGISTDITERKKGEEEKSKLLHLADLEQRRLKALVDTSPVGIVVIEGSEKKIVLLNKEMERILGFQIRPGEHMEAYEASMVFRRQDGTLYAVEDRPLERALLHGETVQAEEIIFEFSDSRRVTVLFNATPIYSADGKITGAIGVIQDISPLEELEKLRSEFLGMVSHELKTPITAIKGSAATMLGSKSELDPLEVKELFQIIDEQSDHLTDLVNNLLDMTRIEAGALSVSAEPVKPKEMLEDALVMFRRGAGSREIRTDVPDDLPLVKADRRRIVQVIANLLSNATKFSPPDAPIEIEARVEDNIVRWSVRDYGVGIPKDKIGQLFKKFSQVHEENRNRLSGSGLGLAISRGIVEAHGGRIWAESPGPGKGSVFSFTLAVATGVEVSQSEKREINIANKWEHMGKVRRVGEKTRVMAVDDDTKVLRYLQRALSEGGYQPIVTSDPKQVIGMVESEEPDVVLLDIMLPGTTGFELLKRIREFSGVPVIFLTARSADEDVVRALKMGADDYIGKPFSPSELLARIEASLRRRAMPDRIEVRPPFALKDLVVNYGERRVTMNGKEVALSATEYKVLYELTIHAGMVLTHDQILQRVWGPEYSGETELVRSFIRNLRRKLGDDARLPKYIFTEPQVGYRMPKAQV